jgi:exodeoxyribonuclease VII small subunit
MSQTEPLTFEEAYAQLEATVRRLEEGGLPLEESLALYERGMELATLCTEQLDQAELRVRQLLPSPSGEPVLPALAARPGWPGTGMTAEPFGGWQEP